MIVWVVVRRLLALIIRLLLLNKIVTLGVAALAAVVFIVYPATQAMTPGSQNSGQAAPIQQAQMVRPVGAANEAPPAAVQNYIKGMETFDAKLMWNSLSADAINQIQSKVGTVDAYQQALDQMKQSGARYEDVSYVGGYPLKNGARYFFFVMTRRGFAGPNVDDQVFYVFTVGPDGKIVSID